ncbi:efflux RND transporter periplasmic adaptor subunit [Carboxylicivirga sp. N1Y90]|uniref:efflux RND transporter periplasmic adaptor subunit n=1 Tax=Carboxylicivirga fragile TaxID=3417571 RepID=UPI003D343994|nr:efflux RND transporter periplasmic adaptor subunit [Marinilabiliaceae bacterium N1Y90]
MTTIKITQLAITFVFSTILSGCQLSNETTIDTNKQDSDLIRISQQHFESEDMKIGTASKHTFTQLINCNGTVSSPPNAMAHLNSKLNGRVETINCRMGDYVTKGEVLVLISTSELILLQEDYLKNRAELKKNKAEFKRRKTLFDENIGTEKDYLKVESEYYTTLATYNAFKLQLELLKLNVENIESGKLYKYYPIISPINGHISKLDIALGQNINEQSEILEIIDTNQLQLSLAIFEHDAQYIALGDTLNFGFTDADTLKYKGVLTAISKTINPESKTLECKARILSEAKSDFINGVFVQTEIISDTKSALALPKTAVTKKENQYYVFYIEKHTEKDLYLRQTKVETGMSNKEFIEIVNADKSKELLISGIYNLMVE